MSELSREVLKLEEISHQKRELEILVEEMRMRLEAEESQKENGLKTIRELEDKLREKSNCLLMKEQLLLEDQSQLLNCRKRIEQLEEEELYFKDKQRLFLQLQEETKLLLKDNQEKGALIGFKEERIEMLMKQGEERLREIGTLAKKLEEAQTTQECLKEQLLAS